jgi:uncharacterized protein YunC (DUF1805 family)
MIETEMIETKKGAALGIKADLKLPLLLIRAEHGWLGCGYFSTSTPDRTGEAAAVVTGVKTFAEMLSKPVAWASQAAHRLGVVEGMAGKDALEKIM